MEEIKYSEICNTLVPVDQLSEELQVNILERLGYDCDTVKVGNYPADKPIVVAICDWDMGENINSDFYNMKEISTIHMIGGGLIVKTFEIDELEKPAYVIILDEETYKVFVVFYNEGN